MPKEFGFLKKIEIQDLYDKARIVIFKGLIIFLGGWTRHGFEVVGKNFSDFKTLFLQFLKAIVKWMQNSGHSKSHNLF